MDPLQFFLIVLLGSIIAGVLGALLGLGGGIIIIPMLTLALGVDIHYAIGASIVSVIATSSGAAAAYVRDRITNLRIGMLLEITTTTGAVSGAFIAGLISVKVLYIVFAVLLAYSAVAMFRKQHDELPPGVQAHPWARRLRLSGAYSDAMQGKVVAYDVAGVPLALALMYVAGTVSGLLGIGGGVLKVPAMDMAMKLPMKVSTATSNFMIGVTAAASAGVYFARGDIVPFIAGPVAMGVLIGATLGTHLMIRLNNRSIRQVFVVVLIAVAVQMAARGLGIGLS
ncbi:MAG: sulfite exporter TauE/SafE family protein [Chloroflexi bacterium]|nr:sulfite exporter TauE/SafE family protein [Chloroflexota bacterium]